jgi:putative endonuclease
MAFLKRFSNKKEKGHYVEQQVQHYLEKQHLRLIAKNYTKPVGEIDLIMFDTEMVIFVEVRYRQSNLYGKALETVTKPKQKKLIKTSLLFLQENSAYQALPCRFDIVSVSTYNDALHFDWLKNAFY